ncbi:MAG TPA: prephenate dehydrogenase/arogenate dehydrogenase family protein [Trueperaceae bacterium]|nr:prephenate dehydrogenase/arogenate dehydrogenase family protein [Trueperaceae bacterium]
MGGSVGLGIRQRGLAGKVIGYDPDPVALEAAVGLGVVDEVRLTPGSWLAAADLVVLAAPTLNLGALLADLAPHLSAATVVTDVGSVKQPITAVAASLRAAGRLAARFVGGHPMAGSERGGVLNADPSLLENAVWVLTPDDGTDLQALGAVTAFVEALGARPLEVPPTQHDELVATVSHLPYLAAVALTTLIDDGDERALKSLLAAGGFRDLTRVASGDPRMSRDMLSGNREAVARALRAFRQRLDELEAVLDSPDLLLERAQIAKRTRDGIPIVRRGLLPTRHEAVVAVPDRPGEFARITAALAAADVNIKDFEVLGVRESGGAVRIAFELPGDLDRGAEVLRSAGYEVRTRNGSGAGRP